MTEEIKHYQVNGKYKIQFERGATKGIDGFKVEVNGDNLAEAQSEVSALYEWAKERTNIPAQAEK